MIPLLPPVIISLPDVKMCDASHHDDDGDGDVVCMGADTKGGKVGPDMRCVLVSGDTQLFQRHLTRHAYRH